jgi:hypothetical protein
MPAAGPQGVLNAKVNAVRSIQDRNFDEVEGGSGPYP